MKQVPGRVDVAEVAAIPEMTLMAEVAVMEVAAVRAEVEASTATAAHGRDHDHVASTQFCHPHAVEVICLGRRALTVCHDCRVDSGFIPRWEAERLASRHRDQSRGNCVSLSLATAS